MLQNYNQLADNGPTCFRPGAAAWLRSGVALLALLSGCSPKHETFPMQKVDWDFKVGGNGNLNMIRHLDLDPQLPEVRRYWTGGTSSGKAPMSKWPDIEIAMAQHGDVTVKLYALSNDALPGTGDRAMSMARVVASAVSIWPGPDTRVAVDVHLVPKDVSYEYARLISWKKGEPFRLTLFVSGGDPGKWQGTEETAVHELFHVMTGLVGQGESSAIPGSNPHLMNMTNEAFAEVYAACGTLLANGQRAIRPANVSISIDGKKYQGYLTGTEIRYFFEHYVNTPVIQYSGPIMAGSAFRALYGDTTLLRADDAAGQSMLALCARIAPDHRQLADWLRSLNPPPAPAE